MSNITPYSGGSAALSSGTWPSRKEERALAKVQSRGTIDRAVDVEQTRRRGNQIELEGALTVHTARTALNVAATIEEMTADNPHAQMLVAPILQTGLRKMMRLQEGLF